MSSKVDTLTFLIMINLIMIKLIMIKEVRDGFPQTVTWPAYFSLEISGARTGMHHAALGGNFTNYLKGSRPVARAVAQGKILRAPLVPKGNCKFWENQTKKEKSRKPERKSLRSKSKMQT